MTDLGTVTEEVLQRLTMVEGLDAQIYAEPRIRKAIQYRFDTIFDMYFWPTYTVYQETYTLDGSGGVITGDVTTKIRRWKDIHSIFWGDSERPLGLAPVNVRHDRITYPCIRPNMTVPSKAFQILPLTTVGNVMVTYRTYPGKREQDEDVMLIDEQLLILGTCSDVLESDAINASDAQKFNIMFEQRLKQEAGGLLQMGVEASPVTRSYPTRWR